MKIKKILIFFMVMFLASSVLVGCKKKEGETVKIIEATFTDSLGRKVAVPAHIRKVAVTGPLAQIAVFAVAPEKLVGFSNKLSNKAKKIISSNYKDLPVLGQLYGGKGDLNSESLIKSGAEVVIDIGETKEGIIDDMDNLQEQTGIPFVHINSSFSDFSSTFEMLGELLGEEKKAEMLTDFCNELVADTNEILLNAKKQKILYLGGDTGLNVIAKGSYHAEVIDIVADNVAVLENYSSKGTGDEVDIEQIIKWDPDVIVFAPDSIFDRVEKMPEWENIRAIKNNNYFECLSEPYNCLTSTPSIQRILGYNWLTATLYPEEYTAYYENKSDENQSDFSMIMTDFYSMFYSSNLSIDDYNDLVKNSIGKAFTEIIYH